MLDLLDELNRVRQEHVPAVLCIVVSTAGSTPRKAGSKMLVYEDGSIKGTIGGGAIEHQVIQEALRVLEHGLPVLKRFGLLEDLNMECGGSMEIYSEPVGLMPRLMIFGGGHIGKALAGYASGLGFFTRVIDQRQDIFTGWGPEGVEITIGDYLDVISNLEFNDLTYIVVVTPKHEFDEMILLACAPRRYAYLGMIGSKRKVAEIRKRASEQYNISQDILDKIDMPIGIPFAAETPSEIAISIVAKLIDVKNKQKNS
ncbi:MAG: XdhC family protein [Lentimicrobium sp.]